MHNAVEKSFETMWKKKMDGRVDNQVFTPGITHNLKCAQCESQGK
jgi:hypothetical protein